MEGSPRQERVHPSPIRILSVEGSAQVREAIHHAMSGAGFAVEHAPGAAEALRRIEGMTPEVVIVSVPLPDADAPEFCHLIRGSAGGAHTAILLIATEAFEARSQAAALESGADACVSSTDPNLLVAAVRALLRSHPGGRQLEAVLEATTDNVIFLDPDWRFHYVNQRARDSVTGGRDLIGQTLWEAFPDAVGSTFEEQAHEAVRTGSVRHLEAYYPPLASWFEIHIHPLHGGLVVTFRNISNRRKIESERENLIRSLRESEERFRALVDQASDAFFVHDEEGHFVDVNQRACQSLGYTHSELLRMSVSDVVMDFDLARAQRTWRGIRPGEAQTVLGRERRKDGSVFEVEVRLSVCLVAGERLYLGLVRDISERRRMEDELRLALADASSSRSQMKAVFEAMQDGVIVFDMESKVVLANDALAHIGGFGSAAELPRDMRDFGRFELSTMDGIRLPTELWPGSCVLRGESFTDRELRVRRTDTSGEWIVSFSGKPIYDAGGNQVLAVMVVRDITGRKRSEAQTLEEQKLESVGLLAGGIAHDFNNLLGSVVGYASLLEEEVAEESLDKVHAILQSGQRAADLTRQLLAYAGKGSFVVQSVDLTGAVREVLGVLRESIPGRVQVEKNLESGLPPVEADPEQIQQIVMNLTLNAAEAIPESSTGTVTLRTRMEEVQRGGEPVDDLSRTPITPGRYVCLEVRDTGMGMDEATRSRIFDPFFTTKFTGRGLGLAAVGGIVRAHRGAIQIASTPGQGTSFRILFPAGRPSERRPPRAAGGTVLVVDDEPMIRGFAEAALERGGYRVLSAAGGRQALALADAYGREIDLVLLDLIMPDLGGEEVAEALALRHPDIAIVVMSGYDESNAATILAGKPVAGFIQKPFSAGRILEHIAAVMNNHRPGPK